MSLERLETRRDDYAGVPYEVRVYYSPASAHTGEERYIVVGPQDYEPTISTVDSSVELNPTSILPWNNPDPLPKDEHCEQVINQFKANVDKQQRMKQNALQ